MAERAGIRFGLPGGRGQLDARSADSTIAQAVDAEQRGFDGVWFAEEHFNAADAPVRRRPSCSMVLAGAVAARTTGLRLGVAALPLLHHPIRLAEQIATLDVLSGGRVNLVVGPAPDRYRRALGTGGRPGIGERLDALLGYWAGRPVEIDGVAHAVEPPPTQRPHPPLYLSGPDDEAIIWAAERGYAIIIPALTGPTGLRRRLELFAAHGGRVADAPVERFCFVAETDTAASDHARPLIEQLLARARHPRTSERPPADTSERDLDLTRFVAETAIVGGPDTVAERIAALRDEHAVHAVNLRPSLTGLCPLSLQRTTIALFAEHVSPQLNGA